MMGPGTLCSLVREKTTAVSIYPDDGMCFTAPSGSLVIWIGGDVGNYRNICSRVMLDGRIVCVFNEDLEEVHL